MIKSKTKTKVTKVTTDLNLRDASFYEYGGYVRKNPVGRDMK